MEGDNKKNIAVVINSLILGGGAGRVASIVGSELNKRGYQVHFLVFTDVQDKYEYNGIYFDIGKDINIKNTLGALLAIFRRGWRIKKYCKEHNIDTVISFMEEANFACIVSKTIFKNKTKIIISIRNNPFKKKKNAKKIMKLFYPFADIVTVVSKKAKMDLQNNFGLEKIEVIYNPINLEKIEYLSKQKLPFQYSRLFQNNFVFINIGRLIEQKGQIYLIHAFKEVVNSNKDVKLIILGEGELRGRLENLINKLGLEKNVFLLGNKKNVYKYLTNSDCFILSSLWEGLPNTLLEAMAVGLPIISTDCATGPREIVAPDLLIDEKIEYPYRSNGQTLLSPFNLKDDYDLREKKERLLAEEMLNCINNKRKKQKNVLSNFRLDFIIDKWKKLNKF